MNEAHNDFDHTSQSTSSSVIHVCQTTVNILSSFVFLNVLAEWTASLFNISEFVLVLHEELAALVTDCNGHVWYHILEVLPWLSWTQIGVIDDENLLITHTLQNSFVYFNWLVGVSRHLSL